MKVEQIASVLNNVIMKEITGAGIEQSDGQGGTETVSLVAEDLRNIVDVGKTVLNFTDQSTENHNNFVGGLIDQIGRVMFVDRTYKSTAPKIVYDSWEYGSIMQKVRAYVADFQDNTSWKLADIKADAITNSKVPGVTDYSELDPYVLSIPNAEVKFYNNKITYECPITIAERQLKSAFRSAQDMAGFIAMIENRIALKMTLSTDALVMRTINNLIGLKIAGQSPNVVNLLTAYNNELPVGETPLTAEIALKDTEFLRFATKTMALYKDYLKTAGSLYNEGDYITFTPEDKLKFVVLSEFAKDMETYLYADTYHNEFVTMEGYTTVPFWQGTGVTGNDFESRSTIKIKVEDGTQNGASVDQTGIIGVMFDRDAAAVCNENYRTTSAYNPRGEYTNYFYKYDSSYLNDTMENCVVFLVADTNSDDNDGE